MKIDMQADPPGPEPEQLAAWLPSDPRREAVASMRGYDWQRWLTVEAWLSLPAGEAIWIEWAEDFTIASKAGRIQTVMARDRARSISLGQSAVRKAIDDAWSRPTNVRTVFTSRSTASRERNSPLDIPAIDYWRLAALGRADPNPLRAYLIRDGVLPPQAQARVLEADQAQFEKLLQRVSWVTGHPPLRELRAGITAVVGRRLAALGLLAHSGMLSNVAALLFEHVARVGHLPDRNERRLTAAELDLVLTRHARAQVSAVAPAIEHRMRANDGSASGLPSTPIRVHGRGGILSRLDKALASSRTSIVVMRGPPGIGKTAAVGQWLTSRDHRRFGYRVFEWSFYRQGDQYRSGLGAYGVTSDQFIDTALRSFGASHIADSSLSARAKARALADAIRDTRSILILDGLEPLQIAPAAGLEHPGLLKDSGIATLLGELVRRPASATCVVTTRVDVADLAPTVGRGTSVITVPGLTPSQGGRFLRWGGVAGPATDLAEASRELGGHPLSLVLLARWLVDTTLDRHVKRRVLIDYLDADDLQNGRVGRLLRAYVEWLASAGENGARTLQLLWLVSLFDQPCGILQLEALRGSPELGDLTASLRGLTAPQWRLVLVQLRRLGLTYETGFGPSVWQAPDALSIELHPVLRQFLSTQASESYPEEWKLAHRMMYAHFSSVAAAEPATLNELQPLFRAVYHGCRGGVAGSAFEAIYQDRIRRGYEAFCTKKLGAFGSELATLSNFFDRNGLPLSDMSEDQQGLLYHQMGFALRGVGFLDDAVRLTARGKDIAVARCDWKHASRRANNESELALMLGDIAAARSVGEESVLYADRNGEPFEAMAFRTTLAEAEYAAGRTEAASRLFRLARRIQARRGDVPPTLYSVQGYRQAELLLDPAETFALLARNHSASVTDEGRSGRHWRNAVRRCSLGAALGSGMIAASDYAGSRLLARALGELVFARATICSRVLCRDPPERGLAAFDRAIDGLREAGQLPEIIKGLIARATGHILVGAHAAATEDLAEAGGLAAMARMPLLLLDIELRGTFRREKSSRDAKLSAIALASQNAHDRGYGRRRLEFHSTLQFIGG